MRASSTPPSASDALSQALNRLSLALENLTSDEALHGKRSLSDALAYRWQPKKDWFSRSQLAPVDAPQLITFSDLKNVDAQRERVMQNTHQFVHGFPANNVLMTGARGTGKSSLVRACLAEFQGMGLRLIEIDKHALDDLPLVVNLVRQDHRKFLVFCDDLSFEEGELGYKGLKTVLDGSVAGPSPNVLIYATSNRRHMVTERMSDNLASSNDELGEIHPGDSIEEKISLSDRFGLHLHFYQFSQEEYLDAVAHWLSHFGRSLNDDERIKPASLQWATSRGTRSGRSAWQFARDYAGQQMLSEREET